MFLCSTPCTSGIMSNLPRIISSSPTSLQLSGGVTVNKERLEKQPGVGFTPSGCQHRQHKPLVEIRPRSPDVEVKRSENVLK